MRPTQPSELQRQIMTGMGYWPSRITSKAPSYSFTLAQDWKPIQPPSDDVDFAPQPYVTAYRAHVGVFDGKPCYRVTYGKEEMILCPHLMIAMEKTT